MHIFAKNYWGNLQWEVADIDWEANTVYLGKGGYQINDIMQGEDATGISFRNKKVIRLDCIASNPQLFSFYESNRYQYMGQEGDFKLFEKKLLTN